MKHFYKVRIIVVYDFAVSDIQFCDFVHIFFAELKIPDVHVLFHTVFVNGFWNYDNAALYVPAESNLSRALSVFFSDRRKNRMSEDAVVSFCEWSPCFRTYAVFFHQCKSVFLLEERMKLYLVDCRDHIDCLAKICQTCRIEVADTDGTKFSFFVASSIAR